MSFALELCAVRKRFHARVALDDLCLKVPKGAVFGMVGSNGAGKTTTMSIVMGLLRPDGGTMDVLGSDVFSPETHAGRVSLMPQDSNLPREATSKELLVFYAMLQGMSSRQANLESDKVIDLVNLSDRAGSKVRSLSHGMRRRVVIAQAFLGDPELVLLDEPMSGLDPKEVVNIRSSLLRKKDSQTVIISSHNLFEVERVCDYVVFIEKGRNVRQDRMDVVTGRCHVLNYTLGPGNPPVAELQELLPELVIAVSDNGSSLSCRYSGDSRSAGEINRRVLACLLGADTEILEVRRGTELEDAYMGDQDRL